MSGVGFSEFLILCVIGLIVLGPERLPKVANQIGRWVGQAKRMTRVMRRQLQDELNFDDDFNIMPGSHPPPRADDHYSPLHKQADDDSPVEEPAEVAEEPELENDDSDGKRDT